MIGGFHLTGGGIYEDAIEPTITELKKIGPRYLIPCHCTGWKATNRIIQELPEKFLQQVLVLHLPLQRIRPFNVTIFSKV